MLPRSSLFSSALCVILSGFAACSGESGSQRDSTISVRDSIRVRREAAFAIRPDSFGDRVDSLRIFRGTSATGSALPWIIVISDFQCSDCRRLALEVLPTIRRDIAERGVAQLAFVNYPQNAHFNARFAAIASLCAGSAGRYWEMHDSLFAALPRWDRMPDPQEYMDSLAIRIGVPAEVQHSCRSRKRLLRLLDGDIQRSQKAGATELPTVFVGSRRLGASELTVEGIRRALAAATVSPR